MSIEARLLPLVAITGSSILVSCGGYGGSSCGSYGSYGSYGGFFGSLGARRSRASKAAGPTTHNSQQAYAPVCGAPPAQGADGIYEGTLTNPGAQQGNSVFAIIAETGDGRVSSQDGTYYRLSLAEAGYSVRGTFSGYSTGVSFPNGGLSTAGTVGATLTLAGLSGTLTDNAGHADALALTYDNTYAIGSSLATLVGAWSYSTSGFSLTLTIQADGTLSGLDASGCSYSGAFSLIDPAFDAYSESYTRTCNGSSVGFTGLASYFPAAGTTPAQIRLLADDGAGQYLVADLVE